MKRLLIVSPHFPPVNTADMQRVRMLLPYLRENGWEAEILCVSPEAIAAPMDTWLLSTVPEYVKVHRVSALSMGWSWVPGLGTLGFRALYALASKGKELLKSGNFDLVYFSTTVFEVHLLGPRWKKIFGIPFVMDYQDPWVNDYYRDHPEVKPPGGRIKYTAMHAIHGRMEPKVLAECAGITSVSPDYPVQLQKRYHKFENLPVLVQAFSGCSSDFEHVKEHGIKQSFFDPADGNIHWVYVGAIIPGMLSAIRALFSAVKNHMPPGDLARLRIHFIGTSYAAKSVVTSVLQPAVDEYGLGKVVTEQSRRIPYSGALCCLMDADALLAIGSDDPAYTASKIYPYLLANKPLLAIYHELSSVVGVIDKVGGAELVTFNSATFQDDLAKQISEQWLINSGYCVRPAMDENKFQKYTDIHCAKVLSDFLSECIKHG